MAKKKSQLSDDETIEQVAGEPVNADLNPDGITIDPSTDDSEKVTVEIDETPVTPVVTETPVTDEKSVTPVDGGQIPVVDEQKPTTPDNITDTPVTDGKTVITNSETPAGDTDSEDDEKPIDKEPVKLNEFKRFNIRFGYSIDSRSTTTRRTLSTTEIVKQFVKAPTCFIAFETKEDLKDFETLLKVKTIKVEDKEGKLVDFSDAAKKHLVERVTELSKYWIVRNSK